MWKKKTLHEDYKWGEKCFVTWYSRIQGYTCEPRRRQIGRQTGKQTQNGEVGVRQKNVNIKWVNAATETEAQSQGINS